MKTFKIILVLFFLSVPALLFAQSNGSPSTGTSTSTDSSTSISTDSSTSISFGETAPTFQGMDNPSNRGFIGSGAPTGFVGIDEIYDTFASNSSANSTRRQSTATTSRSAARTTQRRTMTASTAGRAAGNSSGQTVRAATSADFDYVPASSQNKIVSVQPRLSRIPGIQNGQITLKDSPTGMTAVLTGTVPSEKERKLAKQLLLLEPGISTVENQLEVR